MKKICSPDVKLPNTSFNQFQLPHGIVRKAGLVVEKKFFICYNNFIAEQKGFLDKRNEITGDFCGGKKWTNIWN